MRDYDPTTGRYIQADPLGLVDGASVYGYALQNPGRYTDPTGEFVPLVPVAIAALYGGAWNAVIQAVFAEANGQCYTWSDAAGDFAFGAAVGGGVIVGAYLANPSPFSLNALAPLRNRGAAFLADEAGSFGGSGAVSAIAGGGAKISNLNPNQIAQIQNAVNNRGVNVAVVGSKASGGGRFSDFDFVVTGGTSRNRNRVRSSLPTGWPGTGGNGSGQDFLPGPVNTNKPHILFSPNR